MKNQVFSEERKREFDPPAREAVKKYYVSLGCQVEECEDPKPDLLIIQKDGNPKRFYVEVKRKTRKNWSGGDTYPHKDVWVPDRNERFLTYSKHVMLMITSNDCEYGWMVNMLDVVGCEKVNDDGVYQYKVPTCFGRVVKL